MTDKEKWSMGVAFLSGRYQRMSPSERERLSELAAAVRFRKSRLHLVVEGADAGRICAECAGECCKSGKNHLRAADVMAYLDAGKRLFEPSFANAVCPYMDESGCLMEPEFRPYSCITFICDRVEERLSPAEKGSLLDLERGLRSLYEEMGELLGPEIRSSLLCLAENR